MSKMMWKPFEELFLVPLRNGLTRPKSVRGNGVKMINMGEIFAYSRIGNISMDRVPLSENEAKNFLLEKKDLLFARQSLVLAGAGKCAIVIDISEQTTWESHIIRARLNPEIADPEYYYYFFNSKLGRQAIESIVEQVAAAGIRGSDLAKLRVPFPPLSEQRAIAYILGSLDQKIELNRQMNETLEAMARALFKDWFVDFGPVRAKMAGQEPQGLATDIAALFPDALDDEGKPVGWHARILSDIASPRNRTVQPSEIIFDTPYIGLEHMPRRSITLSSWETAEKVTSTKACFIKNDILFGKLRPYFHKVGIAPIDGICSTDIVVLVPKYRIWLSYVLLCVSSDEFVAYTNQTSDGTKMPRTSWTSMGKFSFSLPPDERLASIFNQHIEPMLERVIANIHENRTLADLRDLLLPKLLSGEVRVSEAEAIVSDVL